MALQLRLPELQEKEGSLCQAAGGRWLGERASEEELRREEEENVLATPAACKDLSADTLSL